MAEQGKASATRLLRVRKEVAYNARRDIALDLRGVLDLLHPVFDLRNGHAVGKLGLRLMAVSWAPAGLYWAGGLSRRHQSSIV